MPEVELTEEQYEYLESLRTEISDEFVGPYGHVRMADAMQYLIDTHDGEVDPALLDGDVSETDSSGTASGGTGGIEDDGEPDTSEGDGTGTDPADESEPDADGAESSGGDDSDEEKLNSMMQLLDQHDEVWQKAGNDAGYEVELPEGGTETVKTKDDVRALLFKHYR
jgi:hypothetical protein